MLMDIFYIVIGLLIGAFVSFIVTKKYMTKQIKNNPPITEKQIRALYMQMGRKPSEAQIKAAMRQFEQNK